MNNTINWDTTLNMLLSPAEAALLAVIWERYALNNKAVIISYFHLAKYTNIPSRSIAMHINTLKQFEFLHVYRDESSNTNAYVVKQSNIIERCNEICSKRNPVKECARIRNECIKIGNT